MSVQNTDQIDALNDAITQQDYPRVKELLTPYLPMDVPGRDGLPIHVAARNPNLIILSAIIKQSLQEGVSIDVPDPDGNTALHHLAAAFKSHECSELLAEYSASAEATNDAGQTPADVAAAQGNRVATLESLAATLETLLPFMRDPAAIARCETAMSLKLGYSVPRDQAPPDGFVPVEGRLFDRPTLLCLSGRGALTEKEGAGIAWLAQRVLGRETIEASDIAIIGAAYPFGDYENGKNNDNYNNLACRGLNPGYNNPARLFVRDHLLPLVTDSDGAPLPSEQAMRRMRNVNILTYSYGGVMAYQIGNALAEGMDDLGYDRDDIDQITRQVSLVTLGNSAVIGCCDANFSGVHFLGAGDREVRNYAPTNFYKSYQFPVPGEPGHDTIITLPEPGGKDECMVAFAKSQSQIDLGAWEATLRHEIYGMKWYDIDDLHNIDVYAYAGPAYDPLTTTMLAMILTNSLNNSLYNHNPENPFTPLPDFMTRFLPPERIDFACNGRGKARTSAELTPVIPYTQRVLQAAWASGQEFDR